MNLPKLVLTIRIEGDLTDLFCAGPNDIKNVFLPNALFIKPEQITGISFQEKLTADEHMEVVLGNRPRLVHKDNFWLEE